MLRRGAGAHPPAEPGPEAEQNGSDQPRPPLLAYLHEDFAQRYKRSAQLCREDAAHEEIPQLSPEVLRTKTAVRGCAQGPAGFRRGGLDLTPSISLGSGLQPGSDALPDTALAVLRDASQGTVSRDPLQVGLSWEKSTEQVSRSLLGQVGTLLRGELSGSEEDAALSGSKGQDAVTPGRAPCPMLQVRDIWGQEGSSCRW